jgi:dihydroorotate dehydrogenase (fumarate)/dihydroorotate dehydrogenase
MSLYTGCLRPLLFRVDPERVHDRAIRTAEWASGESWLRAQIGRKLHFDFPSLAVEVAGMRFRHPLGLAAGFDKNGRGIPLWEAFGFSHVEIGSVSAHFSAGNPKPRLFRVPEDCAIVVNYGLPNEGADRVGERIAKFHCSAPLGLNIVNTNRGQGAPPETDEAIIADYVTSVRRLEPVSTYLVLNLSCPNTCDGRAFVSDSSRVRQLLDAVGAAQPQKPLFLKVAPFAETAALEKFLETVDPYEYVRGFSINLPPGKPPGMSVPAERLKSMPGAVSGKPAEAAADRAINQMYSRIDRRRHVIIGSGGVFTAEDAWRKIQLGASLVQLLTAMIYEGPTIVHRICEGLARIVERERIRNLHDAVGSAAVLNATSWKR